MLSPKSAVAPAARRIDAGRVVRASLSLSYHLMEINRLLAELQLAGAKFDVSFGVDKSDPLNKQLSIFDVSGPLAL